MKPDWKDAPEWAKWLAMDQDGSWWWYEEEPVLERFCRWGVGSGLVLRARSAAPFEDSLEQRPTEE